MHLHRAKCSVKITCTKIHFCFWSVCSKSSGNTQQIPCLYVYSQVCGTPLTFSPVLVIQVRPSLLASTAAVTVVPLLPPQPTSITPSRGTRLSVRNVISVVWGVTCCRHGALTQWGSFAGGLYSWFTMWQRLHTHHDFVPFSRHCCGVIGIVSHYVLFCVPHIRAVHMDVHWHGCRVCT